MPLNMKVVSLNKLHNFYIGRFLKCLGEIWRTGQKFSVTQEGQSGFRGFWLGFDHSWTKVDQGGSLGVVGGVFEVMTQIDHRLTKVNPFD
jgi:hypothetical protein